MKTLARTLIVIGIVASLFGGAGVASADGVIAPMAYWAQNRLADFMDIFSIGAGITTENKLGGPIPPSLGVYAEATTLLNLGIITHNGATIEWDGRGAGAFTESRTLYGLGPYRAWRIYQNEQIANYYKNQARSSQWARRMETDLRSDSLAAINRWISTTEIGSWFELTEVAGDPAKKPIHRDRYFHKAFLGVPRGWQTWEYVGGEVAVCEPFLSHLGVTLRAGFDLSEVMDFALGIVCIDFKQDDRRLAE